jgi:hypothetical protein
MLSLVLLLVASPVFPDGAKAKSSEPIVAAEGQRDDSPAGPEAKCAWSMDDRERAARRADAYANAIRKAVAISEGRLAADDSTFVIDGIRNPELLMPTELMSCLPAAYNPDPVLSKHREKWDARGAAQYLGDDPWNRLYSVARDYIDADIELYRLGVQIKNATGEARESLQKRQEQLQEGNRLCRLRADVLAAARKAFGRENFYKFLYQVIAPDMFTRTSTSSQDGSGLASNLLWVEGGCQ